MIKLKDCECTNCDAVNVIDASEEVFECDECGWKNEWYNNEETKWLDTQVKQQ